MVKSINQNINKSWIIINWKELILSGKSIIIIDIIRRFKIFLSTWVIDVLDEQEFDKHLWV